MTCSKHPDREAAGMCVRCGKPFCAECLIEIDEKMNCRKCIEEIVTEKEEIANYTPPPKSRTSAVLLCIFLGCAGAHRLYLHKFKSGVAMLLTFLPILTSGLVFPLGIFHAVIVIADLIALCKNDFPDGYGRLLV